jgi:hypothetical protein
MSVYLVSTCTAESCCVNECHIIERPHPESFILSLHPLLAMTNRPDRPLVVRCTFDKAHKKITFSSSQNCSFDLLKHKVKLLVLRSMLCTNRHTR